MHFILSGSFALLIAAVLVLYFKRRELLFGEKFAKVITLAFLTVFFCRYYFYKEVVISKVHGLEQLNEILGVSPALATVSTLAVWLSYTALSILLLAPFFKLDWINSLIKYFCTPVYILNGLLFIPSVRILMGNEALENFSFSAVMFAIEISFALAICLISWLKNPEISKFSKKYLPLVYAVLAMIVCSMPSYTLQVLFGYANTNIIVDDLTETHRIFIYAGLVIPVLIYFALRDKSSETIRFAMTYMSVALMITFCTRYKYDTFLKPTSWPLHLCNTAMFIVPICLIFNAKKLFYFTYFINVMGAFLAMAMPNYENVNLFDWSLVNFWVNHFPAFFMPLLLVALKVFERPKLKQFYYSMAAFFVYFVLMLVVNAWFTNYDADVDFFFLNSNFIPEKLGNWAENIFLLSVSFNIGDLIFTFHPLYQFLFFLVYVGIALGIWFVYTEFFALADSHYEMMLKNKKIKLDKLALQATLKGRSIEDPMYENSGTCLKLKNFSKKYGASKDYAVKDANLEVHGGEIFGFLGPNGAGKSTIIKSVVGIQPITGGEIEVCGYDCAKQPRQAKAQIGFVPDHYALYEKLTGREYINYIADIYDVSQEDRTKRIDEMVELFELHGAFDNSMKTYSHGMKQKITIMAALVHNPKVWILDEPLTGLDPNSIYQVKECMRRHAEQGNIVFFSSHIIDVVERICDRIAIIKHGTIMCCKSIEEIEKICPLEEFYLKTINDNEFAEKVLFSAKADKAR